MFFECLYMLWIQQCLYTLAYIWTIYIYIGQYISAQFDQRGALNKKNKSDSTKAKSKDGFLPGLTGLEEKRIVTSDDGFSLPPYKKVI